MFSDYRGWQFYYFFAKIIAKDSAFLIYYRTEILSVMSQVGKGGIEMATEVQNGNMYSIKEARPLGDIQIADDVIAIIAGLAATEVDGVAKMCGNITNELVSKLGMKNLSKGVKVEVTSGNVNVDLSIEIKYGYNVREVSAKIKEKVEQAIETMTGLKVSSVRVRIAGVAVEKEAEV